METTIINLNQETSASLSFIIYLYCKKPVPQQGYEEFSEIVTGLDSTKDAIDLAKFLAIKYSADEFLLKKLPDSKSGKRLLDPFIYEKI